jgi:signal transduction histidine kinase
MTWPVKGIPAAPVARAGRGSVVALALLYAGGVAAGLTAGAESPLIEFWILPVVAVGVLSLLWPGQEEGRGPAVGRRPFAAAIAWLLLSPAPVAAAMPGFSVSDGLRIGLVVTAVTLATLVAYRRLGSGCWFPREIRDVLLLAFLLVLGGAASIALGGLPGTSLGGTGTFQLDVALLVRYDVNAISGTLAVLSLWHYPRPQHSTRRLAQFLPVLVPLSVGCLTLPYLYPHYPIAWLVFLPAMWTGLTLTPRSVGIAAIVIPIGPAIVARTEFSHLSRDDWLPAQLVMELLLAVSIVLAFVIIVLREATARVIVGNAAAAEAEAAQNALLHKVIESIEDGVLLVDAVGRIVMSNPAARTLLGPGMGAPGASLSRPEADREMAELVAASLRELLAAPSDGPVRTELRMTTGDRQHRVYALAARPLSDSAGRLHIVVISDITAEHDRRSQLESFAGAVAHDLKNPLASLALWMDVADDEAQDDVDRGREALEQAREVGLRMRDLIDDYLAYTVTREGTLRPAPVDLAALAGEVAMLFRADESLATVLIDAPEVVRADPALVRQLLSNLIGNSVKYRRPGEPAHVALSAGPDDEPGWIRVSVADRGIGIAPAERDRVFEPFSRGSVRSASGPAGTGLGLALCQAIVVRHGGRIVATGNDWGGTTITFTLPEAHATVAA